MQAIIPDTLEGALVLSVIDFFASFVVISGIGLVLAMFPWLNRVSAWREARRHAPGAPAAKTAHGAAAAPALAHAAAASAVDASGDEVPIAAIAAAVAVVLGEGRRIVHIQPAHGGVGWVAEGRSAHHQSHRHASHSFRH